MIPIESQFRSGGGTCRVNRCLSRIAIYLLMTMSIGCSQNKPVQPTKPVQPWWRINQVHTLAADDHLWIVVESEEMQWAESPLASPTSRVRRRQHVVFRIVDDEIVSESVFQPATGVLLNPRISTVASVGDCLFAFEINGPLYFWESGKGFKPIKESELRDKVSEAKSSTSSTHDIQWNDLEDLVERMELRRHYDDVPVIFSWGGQTFKLEGEEGGEVLVLELFVKQNDGEWSKMSVSKSE